MIFLQRLYCRLFQGAFRLALPILPYRDPKILERVEDVPAALSAKGKLCPLIVTDSQINALGLTRPLEEALKRRGLDYVLFDGARPNPTTAMVERALELYRAHGCDSLIAFGGGCINDTLIHLATSAMGFGGVGQSGMGAYHGKRGFETFSHFKSIVDKKTFLDLPMRYRPYTAWKDKLIAAFVK